MSGPVYGGGGKDPHEPPDIVSEGAERNVNYRKSQRFDTGVIQVHYRIRGTRPVSD